MSIPPAPGPGRADGTGLGAVLFVATLLFYMVSITPFVDLTAAASTDPAADNSNPLNQLVFLLLTGALWLYALCSPMRRDVMQPRLLIGAAIVWFFLVSVISNHPMIAIKHVVLAFLTCANAGIVLLLPKSHAQFARLLAFCSLVTLGVAYFGVIFLPRLAIHQFAEIREPMNAGLWRGHFPHKNTASVAMVLMSFFGLYAFGVGLRVRGVVIVVLSVVFLFGAGGKTAIAALPATLIVAWLFERWRVLRVPIVCGGILAINTLTIGAAMSETVRGLVAELGVDPTFTNRTDIWRIGVDAALKRPLTGYGFQLFWQTDEMVYRAGGEEGWAVAAFNGHNAYLDGAVTTGVIGLALTLAWIVALPLADSFRTGTRPGGDGDRLTRLYLNIWLYGLFTACVESIFFSSANILWVFMLVAVYGLRLQRRTLLIEEPAGAPNRPGNGLNAVAGMLRQWGGTRRDRPVVARPRSLRR